MSESKENFDILDIDPYRALTKEEYDNFDKLIKPKNTSKSAADVDISEAAKIVAANFNKLFGKP